jgi:hypothetical protein
MRVTAVGIGGIEKTQAVIVAIEKQPGEAIDSQCGLVGMVPGTHRTRPHGQPAGLNSTAPQSDRVDGTELLWESGKGLSLKAQPCDSGGGGYEEFSTAHDHY